MDWSFNNSSGRRSGPRVVNASLNSLTQQFEVEERKSRSKFDFTRPADADQVKDEQINWNQQGWGGQSTHAKVGWGEEFQPAYTPDARYSSRDNNTQPFHLNFNIHSEGPIPSMDEPVEYSSFRRTSVIPEAKELLPPDKDDYGGEWDAYADEEAYQSQKHTIPYNRIEGAYDSVDHYLYTHFELMRKDNLIPMQNAIRSYRATVKQNNITDSDNQEVLLSGRQFRLYEHVTLKALVFGSRQVLYRIGFRLPYSVRGLKWPTTKRLLEGTMVLLSKDDFQKDIKVATVVQRGEEPMKGSNRFEYMIDIVLERDNDASPLGFGNPCSNGQDIYTMIEATDGYFEAYRHILAGFQKIDPENLPFEEYLVEASHDVQLPYYAGVKRNYDVNVCDSRRRMPGSAKTVDITQTWPKFDINMDTTQQDALKTILSNNIAIIQGPPGTGKTYVGTYAMRVLLKNLPDSIGPIICICQTNHALDQFLEHIQRYDDRIVRIGSRSKSESLKDNLLYELRKNNKNDVTRGLGLGRLYRKRDEISKKIQELIKELYEDPCVTLKYLEKKNLLSKSQLNSLKRLQAWEEKHEQKAKSQTEASIEEDDEWVINSEPKKPVNAAPKHQKKTGRDPKGKPIKDDWPAANPNAVSEEKKQVNPIEIWLKDAITFIDNTGIMYNAAQEQLEGLLEENQGRSFESEEEEEEADEDEVQERVANFLSDPEPPRRANAFINIGDAYKTTESRSASSMSLWETTVEGRTNTNDGRRKLVDYSKISPESAADPQGFNFFEEHAMLDTPQHYVLQRWMKEEPDLTLWPLPVRLEAHQKWVNERNEEYSATLRSLMAEYAKVSQELRKAYLKADQQICRQMRVIGMTSTAAAKYHDLLELVRPRIMVVEEAAEMLEAHIVSAITPSLQHLILIGDHQQLRPQTAVHALSERHCMSVSLFERFVHNRLPFSRLSHQRRMRPEIRMFVDPIYNDPPLLDHADVKKYPAVTGVDKPVFFLSHTEPEESLTDTASKCNTHEAEMAARLSTYLLLQGYDPEDITIITMYAGQRSKIKQALRAERRPTLDTSLIQVSSVDGYQGEENKIIILSLVRSNTSGTIGFLKVPNRVCVSLSRAKHGMYIFGNAGLLCQKSDLWNEIIGNLEDHPVKMIGNRLPLRCQKHGAVTEVQFPNDFSTIPEGGCTRECNEKLQCGHFCNLACHPYPHEDTRCHQECLRKMDGCGHRCARQCYEPCGPCITQVKRQFSCFHEVTGDCSKMRRLTRCNICGQGQ
ncbi:P-loop containing nucleoside triphosphate hydrolase protein [Syncephalastrum racemosum]|uniref:P-loop containing nucleoside triphosphate hydrolase protein n=1 Tax=Syncephalastrum racemosum TaxID=13706 RepID=A0A1X2HFY9_SYNRA|nr:P-loop containing nucleoside triphosphate hydrolase protein [Syncephalastrum racemosum]